MKIFKCLPNDISLVACNYNGGTGRIFDIEKKYYSNAVPKRKIEFLTGRSCARKALEFFDVSPCPIPAGKNREPVWPDGFVGSITHCDGLCAAAVASVNRYRSLGIDAERLQTISPEVQEIVLTESEKERGSEMLAGDANLFCVVFSAKESVFKCLFPLVKRFFDFSDVELLIDGNKKKIYANLAPHLADVVGVKLLEGTYRTDEDHVFTAVLLEK